MAAIIYGVEFEHHKKTFQINSKMIRKTLKGLQTKCKVNSPRLPSGIHALQKSSNKGIHQYLCLLEREMIAI